MAKKEPDPSESAEHIKWEDQMNRIRGIANVFVDKNRHSSDGTISLRFDGELTAFYNLASHQKDPC